MYDIVFDAGMNDVFQKFIQNPGEAGGKSKTAYYPASMEYGILPGTAGIFPDITSCGVPRRNREGAAADIAVQVLSEEVEKEWSKP